MNTALSAGSARAVPRWIAGTVLCVAACADQTASIGWNSLDGVSANGGSGPESSPQRCSDGQSNADETDVDCGGAECAACGVGKRCLTGTDCDNASCVAQRCVPTQCINYEQDPDEQGTDCGGVCPKPCDPREDIPTPSGGGSAGGASAGGGSAGGGTAGSDELGAGGVGDTDQPPFGSCSGCARLSVPFDEVTDGADYVIALPTPADLSSAVISFVVYRGTGSGGSLQGLVQRGPDSQRLVQPRGQSLSATSGWTEFAWDLAAERAYITTAIERIGIRVSADAESGSLTNPTIIYVDSITVSDSAAGPWLFESSATVAASSETAPANVMGLDTASEPPPGSSISWFHRP